MVNHTGFSRAAEHERQWPVGNGRRAVEDGWRGGVEVDQGWRMDDAHERQQVAATGRWPS